MAFFRNRAINLLNAHFALHAVATGSGSAFYVVQLLKAGVSAPQVLTAFALVLAGRFLIRPLLLAPAIRFGQRPILIVGTLVSALQYPLVAEVEGAGLGLAALIVVSAIGETIYWTVYHAYFAALGDDEHRGHQLGAREAIGTIVGVATPLAAGWVLTTYGARAMFAASGLFCALSAIPLLWTPNVAVAADPSGCLKRQVECEARPCILLFAADGWIAGGYGFVWGIALFVSLASSVMAFAGTLALTALVGAVAGPWLGRQIDAGHGRHAATYAVGIVSAVTVLRAVATGAAALAVVANTAGAIAMSLYIPTLMTAVYNQAKRSPCTLRFHIATEGGWDMGGSAGLLVAAALIGLGAPLWLGVLMALPGAAVSYLVLSRWYTAERTASAPA